MGLPVQRLESAQATLCGSEADEDVAYQGLGRVPHVLECILTVFVCTCYDSCMSIPRLSRAICVADRVHRPSLGCPEQHDPYARMVI